MPKNSSTAVPRLQTTQPYTQKGHLPIDLRTPKVPIRHPDLKSPSPEAVSLNYS